MIDKLVKITKKITDNDDYAASYAEHLSELFDAVLPDVIGEEYCAAMNKKNYEDAIAALAGYYRHKPHNKNSRLSGFGKYNLEMADKTADGYAREVNVSWHFQNNEVDFLFNPTIDAPPVNHEWLWQFNRHSYWTNLARAYTGTKDERYARAFKKQLLKWIGQTYIPEKHNNPGSAWRTIECGLRLLGSWQVAFDGFKISECVDDVTLLLMIASMHRQSVHLCKNVTGANWLLMEMNGVYAFASLFPELKDSSDMGDFAIKKMLSEVEAQILPDGFHYELSPDYHSVAVSTAANLVLLAREFGREGDIPKSFLEVLKRAIDAPISMMTPAFTQPRTNDCFTIKATNFADYGRSIFGDRPEYSYVSSNRKEGYIPWDFTSRLFPNSGFVIMRSGWDPEAAYLCFDIGPLGKGHMHQDKLNINIYKGSEELIFDDGGGQYEESEARRYALSGYDHNTALVDGLAQKRKTPLVLDEPVDAHFISREDYDYAVGEYDDTYGDELLRPATHRREVAFFKPDFFLVTDTMRSRDGEAHDYELLFHLDTTKFELPKEYENSLISSYGRKYEVLLVPLDGDGEVELTAVSGREEPTLRGWYNGRNEAKLHPALTASRSISGVKDFRFATLIFPLAKDDSMPRIERSGSSVSVYFKNRVTLFDLDKLDK